MGGEGFSKEQDSVRGEHVLEGLKPSCCQERIEANKWHILESTTLLWGKEGFSGAMPASEPFLSPTQVHCNLSLSFRV